MQIYYIIAALAFLLILSVAYFLYKKIRRFFRRKRLFLLSPEKEWIDIVERNVALYRIIPEKLKKQLWGHVRIFLDEKRFEGCGGIVMTDEIKLTIAAQACILLLNRKTKYFPVMDSIVVYPHAFFSEQPSHLANNVSVMEETERIGESWDLGTVVLAWDHTRQRFLDRVHGQNVVIHEFAHQLDQEDGVADGVPILAKFSDYGRWGKVLGNAFDALAKKFEDDKADVLDDYGLTNHAEFFAVASEAFYENPIELKKEYPELFEELKKFYYVDPSTWASET